jgi:hypothetical protein
MFFTRQFSPGKFTLLTNFEFNDIISLIYMIIYLVIHMDNQL